MLLTLIIMRHLGRFLTNSYKDGFETIPPRTLFRLGICKGHLVQTRTKQSRNLRNQHLKGWSFPLANPSPWQLCHSLPGMQGKHRSYQLTSKVQLNHQYHPDVIVSTFHLQTSSASSNGSRINQPCCIHSVESEFDIEVSQMYIINLLNLFKRKAAAMLGTEYKKIERFWKIGCYEVLDFCKHEWSRSCFFTIFLFLLSFFKSWPC